MSANHLTTVNGDSPSDLATLANEVRNGYAQIPIDQLTPNPWNPNQMGKDEFAQFVAEVKHLGRLPKPVVVRRSDDGYEIVDGEHGWRAAKQIELEKVDCEVIEADDFEAMRQTYKRNQHGKHDPLLQGRMFAQMMKSRKCSQRKFAKIIEVSEGTVRNSLAYAEAEKRHGKEVAGLGVREIRVLNSLPPTVAEYWFASGRRQPPSIVALEKVLGREGYRSKRLEESGLLQYIKKPWSADSFIQLMTVARTLLEWEARICRAIGVEPADLRPYSRHYYQGVFYVREASMMEDAIGWIYDNEAEQFLLTPDEFEQLIRAIETEPSSARDLQEMLKYAVESKHGRTPLNKRTTMFALEKKAVEENAPQCIKDTRCCMDAKLALMERYERTEGNDDHDELRYLIEIICKWNMLNNETPSKNESWRDVIDRKMSRAHLIKRRLRAVKEHMMMTREQILESIAVSCRNQLPEQHHDLADSIARKLVVFDSIELYAIRRVFTEQEIWEEWQWGMAALAKAMGGNAGPTEEVIANNKLLVAPE